MSDAYAQNPKLAKELDKLAKENGVTIVGTGVNPGFVLDLLVVALTAGNHSVERIEASRVNDLSPYGPTVMNSQGVGPHLPNSKLESQMARSSGMSVFPNPST